MTPAQPSAAPPAMAREPLLLPCPCCGGEPSSGVMAGEGAVVFCLACELTTRGFGWSENDADIKPLTLAIAAWNKRATPAPADPALARAVEWAPMSAEMVEMLKGRGINPDLTLDDYWRGISVGGALHYEWTDKPHRLLYDLIGEVIHLRSALSALRATPAAADGGWRDIDKHPPPTDQTAVDLWQSTCGYYTGGAERIADAFCQGDGVWVVDPRGPGPNVEVDMTFVTHWRPTTEGPPPAGTTAEDGR